MNYRKLIFLIAAIDNSCMLKNKENDFTRQNGGIAAAFITNDKIISSIFEALKEIERSVVSDDVCTPITIAKTGEMIGIAHEMLLLVYKKSIKIIEKAVKNTAGDFFEIERVKLKAIKSVSNSFEASIFVMQKIKIPSEMEETDDTTLNEMSQAFLRELQTQEYSTIKDKYNNAAREFVLKKIEEDSAIKRHAQQIMRQIIQEIENLVKHIEEAIDKIASEQCVDAVR